MGAESLSGSIERITYHNPENGFAVLQVKVRGRRQLATVVGNVMMVVAGEHLSAVGEWTVDRQHGPQFKADQIETTHPATASGIERYLGSGAIRSVGPKLAKKIVEHYGDRSLEIIEDFPEQLSHIHGLGPKRLARIKSSWAEQKNVRNLMLFLHSHGVASGLAARIHRQFGDKAIEVIRRDPYRLAAEIHGIGFKTADGVATQIGIDPHSPLRARAATTFVLQQKTNDGHCRYPEDKVREDTAALLESDASLVAEAIEFLVQQEELVRENDGATAWIALAALYAAETGLGRAVDSLCHGRHPLPRIQVDVAIDWVEKRLDIELAAEQKQALRQITDHPLSVVTGGPGVGKTTLVRCIIEIFRAKGLTCVLAAPTGRAAKRMEETTGLAAKTIHRLLEFDPGRGEFLRHRSRQLEGDLFVIDETSMLDAVLAFQLLRAVPASSCVVLVGDVDQLPSVGPGRVLGDLIDSGRIPTVRLTQIFRQEAASRIISAAHSVNRGAIPDLTQTDELTDFYFVEAEEPEAIQDLIIRLVCDRVPNRFGLDPRRDIQVLSPMNRSALGARQLNVALQEAINPGEGRAAATNEVVRFGWTFRVGDRVLQTVNNYDRDVYNGDLGIIEKVDSIEQEVIVSYEDRHVAYDFPSLDELTLAYVVTIHKSQGSEYPCVIIPLHTQHYMMLQRNLLYTGMTRGKKLVLLVGSNRALQLAIHRQDTRRRFTSLPNRLIDQSTASGPSPD